MPNVPGSRPHSLAVAADNIVLAVNGLGRGVRFDGATVSPIGITKPTGLTAATSNKTYQNVPLYYSVHQVVVDDGGANYYQSPSVTISGVSGAAATVSGGAVDGIAITTSATTHTTTPTVVITGGQGGPVTSGLQGVGLLRGGVNNVQVSPSGASYSITSPPSVTFSAATGVNQVRPAAGFAVLNIAGATATTGTLASIVITDSGHYETTASFNVEAKTYWITAGSTAASTASSTAATYYVAGASAMRPVLCTLSGGAQALADFAGVVSAATVLAGGEGLNYAVPPEITLRSLGPSKGGDGAAAEAVIADGKLTGLSVTQYGGGYDGLVEAVVTEATATAIATLKPRLAGKYLCGVRYRDGAPYDNGGPLCGDMSELIEIDCGEGVNQIVWNLSGVPASDSSPNRLATIELWRTTSDQATTLYRVAVLAVGTAAFVDELSDDELTREDRGTVSFVEKIAITDGGGGYRNSSPAGLISFSGGGGSGAKATAYIVDGAIVSARITERGTGYTSAPTVSIASPTVDHVTAAATATLSGGAVSEIQITAPGAGYDSPPSVAITGDGSGATAEAILGQARGYVQAIRMTAAGSGYTNATVTIAAPTGSTATATATLGSETVYRALPILTIDGYPSAQAHGVPPQTMSIVRQFQDRAWYAGDLSKREPNAIYFSEVDLPESVPESNQVVIQQVGSGRDAISALIPLDSSLYVCQSAHLYRLSVNGNPLGGATATPVAQRGALNDRCWDTLDGIAYIVDNQGMYAFDGGQAEPLSDPVSTFWADGAIDLQEQYSRWYFVHVDQINRVVRFVYRSSSALPWLRYPRRALCYSLVTKAWWEEHYAHDITSAASVRRDGVAYELLGSTNGALYSNGSSQTDSGTSISYSLKTGNLPLSSEPRRAIGLTYTPTAGTHQLNASFFYNGSTAARAARVSADVGTGFIATAGSTEYSLNLSTSRSPLGASAGEAELVVAVNSQDQAVGGDKNMAIRLGGTQGSTSGQFVLHRMRVEGVG